MRDKIWKKGEYWNREKVVFEKGVKGREDGSARDQGELMEGKKGI